MLPGNERDLIALLRKHNSIEEDRNKILERISENLSVLIHIIGHKPTKQETNNG